MTINYPFATIASTSADIHSSSVTLDSLLSDMDSSVRNKLQALWHGEGSDSYQVVAQRWNQAANDVRMALANLGVAVDDSGTGMQGTDRQNAARFTMGA